MSAVDDPGALGQRIRALRDKEGWSQETLAERSGIRQALLSEIERGRSDPRYTTLQRLARAFGISVNDLIGEEAIDPETVGTESVRVAASALSARADLL